MVISDESENARYNLILCFPDNVGTVTTADTAAAIAVDNNIDNSDV